MSGWYECKSDLAKYFPLHRIDSKLSRASMYHDVADTSVPRAVKRQYVRTAFYGSGAIGALAALLLANGYATQGYLVATIALFGVLGAWWQAYRLLR